MRRGLAGVLAGSWIAWAASAGAGPPLVTEDPDPAPARTLEVILAATGLDEGEATGFDAPLLDLSYGFGAGLEVSLSLPASFVDRPGTGTRGGVGLLSLGGKWLLAGGAAPEFRAELAFAPRGVLDVSSGAVARGVVDDTLDWILPFAGELRSGDWRLVAELGPEVRRHRSDRLRYGAYLGWRATPRVEWLAELRGRTAWSGGGDFFAWRVGATLRLFAEVDLLAAAGRTFATDAPRRRDFEAFLGLMVPLDP
jgi:hypothetical protein